MIEHACSSHVVIITTSSPSSLAMVVEPFLCSFLSFYQVVAEWLYENHHGREEVVQMDACAFLSSCLSYS